MGMAPLSTRMAPNHITATVDRFMMRVSTGMVTANRRLTRMAGLEQVQVDLVEALLLVLGAHEGADDPDARQRLAHDLVDAVELALHRLEQRDGAAHDEADDQDHERQDDEQQQGQRGHPRGRPG